jgi:hypothetical protein
MRLSSVGGAVHSGVSGLRRHSERRWRIQSIDIGGDWGIDTAKLPSAFMALSVGENKGRCKKEICQRAFDACH